MPGPSFFETRMGRTFYDHQVPEIMKALQEIARQLKTYNQVTRCCQTCRNYEHDHALRTAAESEIEGRKRISTEDYLEELLKKGGAEW